MSRTTPDLNALNARVRRRELRTSRGGLSVFVAVILMILAGYAALEAGTRAVDHEAWLLAPDAAWGWLRKLPESAHLPAAVVVGAIVVLALGLLLLYAAFAPGKRRIHELPAHRVIALVEDPVMGQALVRSAQLAADVSAEQVRVLVDRRMVSVTVRPTSGVAVDPERVRRAVHSELARQGLPDGLPVNVIVAQHGVVGQ